MNGDYLKYDGRIPEPPYEPSGPNTGAERLLQRVRELEEQLDLAANNTTAADLAQEVECLRAEKEAELTAERDAARAECARLRDALELVKERVDIGQLNEALNDIDEALAAPAVATPEGVDHA